jgi:anti-sigma factor (TIGR02949 family)
MDCKTAHTLLALYLDGELDRADARALEDHIDTCAECRDAMVGLGRLRHSLRTEATRYAAPSALRERIEQATRTTSREQPRGFTRRARWLAAAACVCGIAIGATIMRFSGFAAPDAGQQASRDLFASHWRSLAATSPVDVISSDRHTVKPWFAGKVMQAPTVKDFVDQGFALVGGRIDYVGSERLPVLVYRHGQHLIDVFVLPREGSVEIKPARREGYTLMTGTLDGQKTAIVSDLDGEELARFGRLLDDSAKP